MFYKWSVEIRARSCALKDHLGGDSTSLESNAYVIINAIISFMMTLYVLMNVSHLKTLDAVPLLRAVT